MPHTPFFSIWRNPPKRLILVGAFLASEILFSNRMFNISHLPSPGLSCGVGTKLGDVRDTVNLRTSAPMGLWRVDRTQLVLLNDGLERFRMDLSKRNRLIFLNWMAIPLPLLSKDSVHFWRSQGSHLYSGMQVWPGAKECDANYTSYSFNRWPWTYHLKQKNPYWNLSMTITDRLILTTIQFVPTKNWSSNAPWRGSVRCQWIFSGFDVSLWGADWDAQLEFEPIKFDPLFYSHILWQPVLATVNWMVCNQAWLVSHHQSIWGFRPSGTRSSSSFCKTFKRRKNSRYISRASCRIVFCFCGTAMRTDMYKLVWI